MGNQFKTALLLTAMTVFIIFIGRLLGGQQGMILAFLLAGAMNFFSYWFSDKIILAIYSVREITPDQAPQIYSIVQTQSARSPHCSL